MKRKRKASNHATLTAKSCSFVYIINLTLKMRKLKRFNIKDVNVLTPAQMMVLGGGDDTYVCNTGGDCRLFITDLKLEVSGTCKSAWEGGSVRCYCQNGAHTTNKESRSSCWKK